MRLAMRRSARGGGLPRPVVGGLVSYQGIHGKLYRKHTVRRGGNAVMTTTHLRRTSLLSEPITILFRLPAHLGATDVLVERDRKLAVVALENEALTQPALPPKLLVQCVGDGTLPVELDDPVVKDNAPGLGPLAETAPALVIHKRVLDHFKRGVLDKAQRGA